MKRALSIALLSLLILATLLPGALAEGTQAAKEEDVYGLLDLSGNVKSLYVVNMVPGGDFVDYGDYLDVRNLTGTEPIERTGDEIRVPAAQGRLYYQGALSTKELPWRFAIKYLLDGAAIDPALLAGKSGALEIRLLVEQNPAVDSAFYDAFTLQIGLSLDTKLCANIRASQATIADAGASKQLNYTVMPGQAAAFTVSADVHDFEMAPITINALRMSLSFNIDTGAYTGQVGQFVSAIEQLDTGAASLLEGAKQTAEGVSQYVGGVSAFSEGLADLPGGIGSLSTGATSLSEGLTALTAQQEALLAGASAMVQATFAQVNAQLAGTGLPVLTPENYESALKGNAMFAEALTQLGGVVQFHQGLTAYASGVTQLGAGATQVAGGLSQLHTSVAALPESLTALTAGGTELVTGVDALRDGIATYQTGTAQLKEGTAGFDEQIGTMASDMLASLSGGDAVIPSFVSEKNTNVASVQFVLKSDAIEIPAPEPTPVAVPDEQSIWEKLTSLFGL